MKRGPKVRPKGAASEPGLVLDPPAWLSPEEARAFRALAKAHRVAVEVRRGDEQLLAMAAQAQARCWALAKQLKSEGLTVAGRHGPVANPAIAIEASAKRTLLRCLLALGLGGGQRPPAPKPKPKPKPKRRSVAGGFGDDDPESLFDD